ncbi:ABC transporter ATP-binding protein [Methanosarcina sp. Kolksee]|uniref:ATP-binding cassette domain-containing protein n=1 Tax=Methanosarcina sp. Kolksee TaxID=1434099 RepID=UPI00064FEDAA|nr:ABC transporter ATP-binding protein [Methanosarcina sp. Kolksee]
MKLILNDIVKSFDKKEVLRGASFAFEKGEIYGLLGRNGSGKTTLFNCINEDLRIDGGSILFEENGVKREVYPDDIGYVLSTPVVPEFLTGREFLKFFLDINVNKIPDIKPIDEYFDFVKIGREDRDRLLKDYSHGMKNKMQMLVSFIANPAILLLDEPLTSFDVVVADEMKTLLRQIKKDHIIIISTHIMELALDLCDEIVILSGGVLEKMEKDDLNNEAFKNKIIQALRRDEYD